MNQILIVHPNRPSHGPDLKVTFSQFSPQTRANLIAMLSVKSPLITKAIPGFQLSHNYFFIPCKSINQETYAAYQVFAGKLLQTAILRRWVKNTPKSSLPQSEKYQFRIWLNQLGLKGPKYASVRKILTKNLSGSSAYPNDEKMLAYNQRRREVRHAGKASESNAFIQL